MNIELRSRARRFGLFHLQVETFVEAINKGKRALWIGREVVAMPSECYYALVRQAQKQSGGAWIIEDEAKSLLDHTQAAS